jgi:hypothetical protein
MPAHVDHPLAVFVVSLLVQWSAAYLGAFARRRRPMGGAAQNDFDTVRTAALTLFALIIGFTFSMAVSRYDQRKNLEEAEANAIGTEYVRVDLLAPADAAQLRALLRRYVEQRIAFYSARESAVAAIDAETARLHAQLWAVTAAAAKAQPTPISALVVNGMNDVINAQSYTQAAWWNRIPVAAWMMLLFTAFACNMMIGYGERTRGPLLLLVFPVIVSIPFLLIADIDSPRGGVINVPPQNLLATARSLAAP